MSRTRTIIEAYYRGWVESDREKVRALLADDLIFRSPDDDFDRADAFLDKCWKFSEGFDTFDVDHAVFDESSGYLVYQLGEDFACGELVKLRDGKIAEIYVTYNPTR